MTSAWRLRNVVMIAVFPTAGARGLPLVPAPHGWDQAGEFPCLQAKQPGDTINRGTFDLEGAQVQYDALDNAGISAGGHRKWRS